MVHLAGRRRHTVEYADASLKKVNRAVVSRWRFDSSMRSRYKFLPANFLLLPFFPTPSAQPEEREAATDLPPSIMLDQSGINC
jgi:hypothetical protein